MLEPQNLFDNWIGHDKNEHFRKRDTPSQLFFPHKIAFLILKIDLEPFRSILSLYRHKDINASYGAFIFKYYEI